MEKVSRTDSQEFLREVRRELQSSRWAQGFPPFVPGARPAQLRAGAKILMDRTKAKLRRMPEASLA